MMSTVTSATRPKKRPPDLEPLLQITVGALVVLGTVLLAMGQQNLMYALVAVVATMTALIVTDMKGYFRLSSDATTLAAVAACVLLVVQVVRNVEQSQLLNVANILIYLEIILLFQEKHDRTYWSLMALSLLQVIVAAALNLGLMFGLLLGAYVLVAGVALMLFYAVREIRPFIQASEGDELPVDREETARRVAFVGSINREAGSQVINKSLLKCLGRMIVVSSLATIVIFFTFPRYSTSSWQGARQEQMTTVGFTEEVRLDDIGKILESPEQVMRVEFTDLQGRPYQVDGEPYFRGTVLSQYKSKGLWKQHRSGFAVVPLSSQSSFDLASTVLQRITLQPGSHSVLFNVSPCHDVEGSPDNLLLNLLTRQLTLDEEDDERRGAFRYKLGTTAFRNGWQRDLTPVLNRYTEGSVFAKTNSPSSKERLQRDNPSVVEVAESVIAAASLQQAGFFEKAKALENHFRRSGVYTYSLNVNQNRNRRLDPIEDFVKNHRTGHCEYFAGALTLMLRSQGIPARMVVGYHGGEFNAIGSYYIVRQLHAHAWVEAYLPESEIPSDERDTPKSLDYGCWLRLDPTPDTMGSTDDRRRLAIVTTVREFVDYCQVLWDDYVLGLNSTRQQQAIYRPIIRSLRMIGASLFSADVWKDRGQRLQLAWTALATHRLFGIPTLILLALPAVTLFFALFRWRRPLGQIATRGLSWFSRRRPTLPDRRPQLEVYRRLESALSHLGLVRGPAQTPFEFAGVAGHRLNQLTPDSATAETPRRVAEAYYRFRYGHQPLSDAESGQLMADVQRLEQAVQNSAPTNASSASSESPITS